MDFVADWSEILRKRLTGAGHTPRPRDDVPTLSKKYFNLCKRHIASRPRAVVRSRELTCAAELLPKVEEVSQKSEGGEDLSGYLSKRMRNPLFDDELLNDWGIHHLHLGSPDGKSRRDSFLLFVRITPARMLLIDIGVHRRWSEQRLVQIVHANWPEEIAHRRLLRVVTLPMHVTDDGIDVLRKHGIGSVLQMPDGTAYLPIGSGAMLSRTAADVAETSLRYLHYVQDLERHVRNNQERFLGLLAAQGRRVPPTPDLHLAMDSAWAYVYEQTHRDLWVQLGCLPATPFGVGLGASLPKTDRGMSS